MWPSTWCGDHLVLLVGAEVQEHVQVLELAGWALEDEVSEGGHAQVGAALRQGREVGSAATGHHRVCLSPPFISTLTGCAPADPAGLCLPPHLIFTVLANHLQSTLSDKWCLQHNLGEDAAGGRHRT